MFLNKTDEIAKQLNQAIKQTYEFQSYLRSLNGLNKHPELFELEKELKLLQKEILKERTKEDGDSYTMEIDYKNKMNLFKDHPLIVNYLQDKEDLISLVEYIQTYIQGLLDEHLR